MSNILAIILGLVIVAALASLVWVGVVESAPLDNRIIAKSREQDRKEEELARALCAARKGQEERAEVARAVIPPNTEKQMGGEAPEPRGVDFRIGTIVFAVFAVLSGIVFIAKGGVPLYAIEALIWAGLAVFWNVKQVKSRVANYTVLSLAFVVLLFSIFSVADQMAARDREISDYAGRRCAQVSPSRFAECVETVKEQIKNSGK